MQCAVFQAELAGGGLRVPANGRGDAALVEDDDEEASGAGANAGTSSGRGARG